MLDSDNESKKVYGYAERRLKRVKTSENNKKTIMRFMDFGFSEGLGAKRVEKYLSTLSRISEILNKDFEDADRTDIERIMNVVERSELSEWTKHDYRVAMKKFYRWLRNTEETPAEVRWIKTTLKNSRKKLPKDMLTPKEVMSLITAAYKDRDRAFISMLYESGCRISELLHLRMKDIQQHKHGYQITVEGKTGSRRVLLISSTHYITSWLNQHPSKDNPNSYLWVTSTYKGKCLTYKRIFDILRCAAKRANVKKAVNPHNFRHSRATHLAKHLTEAQMKEFFGWTQGSDMASTYVHLSGRDMDNALLKLHNIPIPEDDSKVDDFSSKTCVRCDFINPPANIFCSRCGTVLDRESANHFIKRDMEREKADEILDTLLKDEEFKAMLMRKVKQLDK
jgi:site-specific recombinase XerD